MIERRQYLMVQLKRSGGGTRYLSITEVAARCGVHPDLIERFVYLGLIDPIDGEEEYLRFPLEVVPLVHKIIRLRNHLGINYAGIGLVLELMNRIEKLESQLQELIAAK